MGALPPKEIDNLIGIARYERAANLEAYRAGQCGPTLTTAINTKCFQTQLPLTNAMIFRHVG